MTEKLWDEKPEPTVTHVSQGVGWLGYSVSEMDPWLEKVKDKLEWQEQHNKQMWMNLCIANKKLEDTKTHLTEYPDVDGGICDDCPYPKERKTRDGACGNCAVGKVKFWLQDHKKMLEDDG